MSEHMCPICGIRLVEQETLRHWKTKELRPYYHPTCEEEICKKEYVRLMEDAIKSFNERWGDDKE